MNLRLTLYIFPPTSIEYFDAFHGSVEINFLVYESHRDRVCVLYSLTNSAKVSVSTFSTPRNNKRENRK